jgi:hypothetical protein
VFDYDKNEVGFGSEGTGGSSTTSSQSSQSSGNGSAALVARQSEAAQSGAGAFKVNCIMVLGSMLAGIYLFS